MRINKYLALKGYATRTGADDLITRGRVYINNVRAVLGAKVGEHDVVEVRGASVAPEKLVYYAYHKPKGIVTHSAQKGERDIQHAIPLKNIFPVGRLDKASHGLIILTNDGRITHRLLSPDFDHEKEYIVTTHEDLRNNFKEKMEKGVDIEGYTTKPCTIRILNQRTFVVTLTEGKKHQIRRMCVALFQKVKDLKRTRIMNIRLGDLPVGDYRPITGSELATFLRSLTLTAPASHRKN